MFFCFSSSVVVNVLFAPCGYFDGVSHMEWTVRVSWVLVMPLHHPQGTNIWSPLVCYSFSISSSCTPWRQRHALCGAAIQWWKYHAAFFTLLLVTSIAWNCITMLNSTSADVLEETKHFKLKWIVILSVLHSDLTSVGFLLELFQL